MSPLQNDGSKRSAKVRVGSKNQTKIDAAKNVFASHAIGMSPSFEWPPKMTELILDGLDGSQAFKELGLTDHVKIGTAHGAITHLN